MTDTTLPPEVAEAVEYVDSVFSDADNGEWACVRAELLRLAKENAELQKAAARGALAHMKCEAELVFAKERIEAMELSTEELETELATLYEDCPDKTLPDEKPTLTLRTCGPVHTCPDSSEHNYSGWINLPNGSGTAVCIKCGHRAIDDAYWM